jgi:hypothetical protein
MAMAMAMAMGNGQWTMGDEAETAYALTSLVEFVWYTEYDDGQGVVGIPNRYGCFSLHVGT